MNLKAKFYKHGLNLQFVSETVLILYNRYQLQFLIETYVICFGPVILSLDLDFFAIEIPLK